MGARPYLAPTTKLWTFGVRHHHNDKRVFSIKVEINRDLYLDPLCFEHPLGFSGITERIRSNTI